jgi:hypothetical protein
MQDSILIRRWIPVLLLALLSFLPARTAEIFVDAKAVATGTGTAAAPFKTIGEALKNAAPGTTITIKGGVYRESANIQKGGASGAPLVIRAAPGERVEVTAFDGLTGWKMEGKLAKLTVKEPIFDLYVGEARQRMSRFPDKMSPWLKVVSATGTAFQVETLPNLPPAEQKGLCVGMLLMDMNGDHSLPVIGIDAATKTVTLPQSRSNQKIKPGDTFVYYNAPSFIKYPGDWSCQPVEGGFQITFWPNDPKDLEKTQFRKRSSAVNVAKANDVTLQGLEITGGVNCGLQVSNATNFRAERCLIYNNALIGTLAPHGVTLDKCETAVVDSCLIFSNFCGISVVQGKDNIVRNCEIFLNDEDGVNFIGRRGDKDHPAVHNTLTHCYIHGEIYLEHPDGLQTWGWVKDCEYDHNLSILNGQNMMMEETYGLKASDSVLFSSVAHQIILGGSHSHDDGFQNMTFVWGHLGALGFYATTNAVRIFNSVFYANTLSYAGTDIKSGNNLLWSPKPDNLVALKDAAGKFYTYKNSAAYMASLGLEVNSKNVDPQFKNIPEAQAVSNDPAENTPDTLHFKRPGSLVGFAKGDSIEINFDGVARTIQSLTADSITFAPALPAAPFRDIIVWGWGKRTDLRIDLSSPIAGGKDQPGAPIDVAAYQRGELDGNGKRSIPELSDEARASLVKPATYPFPFSIPRPVDFTPPAHKPAAEEPAKPEAT